MKIWLDQVREEPFRWDETERIAAAALDRPELLALGAVRWQGEMSFADPGYLLRGHLTYDQTLACNRCLKPHEATMEADVELLIVVEAPGRAHRHRRPQGALGQHEDAHARAGEGEQALAEPDLSTMVVTAEELETRPIVLEQLQLNIPMKPLCRPDCKGLCPRCGADLNITRCSCVAAAPDPRWAALGEIGERLGAPGDPSRRST